jgi:hypothetical protein
MNRDRIEASIRDMRKYYPQFALTTRSTPAGTVAVWRGSVQPIQTTEFLNELLDDIANEQRVYVFPGGEVQHDPYCIVGKHVVHDWMNRVTNPFVEYTLEVQYTGGSEHPKCYVVSPLLHRQKWRHTFDDGLPYPRMCPYRPSDGIWLWQDHTVVDYMDHAVTWLIKWTVWDQADVWIGSEVPHDSQFLLRTTGPNQECWCGSGKKYKKCHMRQDETKPAQPPWSFLLNR